MMSSPPTPNPGRCHVCGKPAKVHLTEANVRGGRKSEKHFCVEHAKAAGLPMRWEDTIVLDDESDARARLEKLHRAANFIRHHGRLPTSGEEATEYTRTLDQVLAIQITDPEVLKSLGRLEELIRFIEKMERTHDQESGERKCSSKGSESVSVP